MSWHSEASTGRKAFAQSSSMAVPFTTLTFGWFSAVLPGMSGGEAIVTFSFNHIFEENLAGDLLRSRGLKASLFSPPVMGPDLLPLLLW